MRRNIIRIQQNRRFVSILNFQLMRNQKIQGFKKNTHTHSLNFTFFLFLLISSHSSAVLIPHLLTNQTTKTKKYKIRNTCNNHNNCLILSTGQKHRIISIKIHVHWNLELLTNIKEIQVRSQANRAVMLFQFMKAHS